LILVIDQFNFNPISELQEKQLIRSLHPHCAKYIDFSVCAGLPGPTDTGYVAIVTGTLSHKTMLSHTRND
jgi:hypothetical protein